MRPLRLDRTGNRSEGNRGLHPVPDRVPERVVGPDRNRDTQSQGPSQPRDDLSEAFLAIERALGGDLTHKVNCRKSGYDCTCGLRGFNRYLGRES